MTVEELLRVLTEAPLDAEVWVEDGKEVHRATLVRYMKSSDRVDIRVPAVLLKLKGE